jgi:hypothetical protein
MAFMNTGAFSSICAISSKRARALDAAITELNTLGTAKSTAGGMSERALAVIYPD